MWGLVHSTFVTTPVTVMGLLASYSAPKEWCAQTGIARNTPHAKTIDRFIDPPESESTRFRVRSSIVRSINGTNLQPQAMYNPEIGRDHVRTSLMPATAAVAVCAFLLSAPA